MNTTAIPSDLPPDEDTPAAFVEALYRGELAPMKPMPGLTEDWYQAYCHWCSLQHCPPETLSYFLHSLDDHFGVRPQHKRYWDSETESVVDRQTVLMFGQCVLDELVEFGWLGEPPDRKALSAIFSRMHASQVADT